jgi:hypothetical protein
MLDAPAEGGGCPSVGWSPEMLHRCVGVYLGPGSCSWVSVACIGATPARCWAPYRATAYAHTTRHCYGDSRPGAVWGRPALRRSVCWVEGTDSGLHPAVGGDWMRWEGCRARAHVLLTHMGPNRPRMLNKFAQIPPVGGAHTAARVGRGQAAPAGSIHMASCTVSRHLYVMPPWPAAAAAAAAAGGSVWHSWPWQLQGLRLPGIWQAIGCAGCSPACGAALV